MGKGIRRIVNNYMKTGWKEIDLVVCLFLRFRQASRIVAWSKAQNGSTWNLLH
jgi:hypothetical protein